MIEFENYNNNVDIKDIHGIEDIDVNKCIISIGSESDVIKINKNITQKEYPPLAAAIVGLNNTAAPLPNKPTFYNAWTNIDAQELFLASKPTCYVILGKPEAGSYTLGEALSKKFNCVHLCPKNIMTDEIEQKTSTGICLEFNIKHGNVCSFEILLNILKIKLQSPAVQHRGYVLSGFPLVPSNKSVTCLIKSMYSEESVTIVNDLLFDIIYNLKKKKPKKARMTKDSSRSSMSSDVYAEGEEVMEEEDVALEELPEEEEDVKAELPKFLLNACTNVIFSERTCMKSRKSLLLYQLNSLFNLDMKPDILIYLTCPEKDLITKRSHKYINYKTENYVTEPFTINLPQELRWPKKNLTNHYVSPHYSNIFNSKYSCRQPFNFERKSTEQICNYRNDLSSLIEDKIKNFHPKHIIKLDARQSIHYMMNNVSERLVMIPAQPVLLADPLYLEEPPEDMDEFWNFVENLNVIRDGVVKFNRYASMWFNRCPVELKKRRSIKGIPKFAVKFTKHIYLMASLENMISFCRNPRPYLKLNYLEPTCRIIVIGTKCSGKTMISECLSWLFDTPVTNYDTFIKSEKEKKYNTFAQTILSEIIATIEDDRFSKWQYIESQRLAKLDTWCEDTKPLLGKYVSLLTEYLEITATVKEIDENNLEEAEIEDPPIFESIHNYYFLRDKLSFLTILDDLDKCVDALSEKNLCEYAPIGLRTPAAKPKLPILGDPDVTEAIAAYIVTNELQKEIEPTIEELMSEMIRFMSVIDTECQNTSEFEQTYGKYIIDGFPSDPDHWNFLTEAKYLPDYTVALVENREIEPELLELYKRIGRSFKNAPERFIVANDPLIKTRLLTKQPPESIYLNVNMILHESINDMLDNYLIHDTEKSESNFVTDQWATFGENIEKFKEDWDIVKLKLEDHDKCLIAVDLEGKSDVQVVEEVLLKLRKCYFTPCYPNEEETEEQNDEEEKPKDILTYNDPQNFGETSFYCPVAYYDHGVLWEGNPEFSLKFQNTLYYFCKEEYLDLFQIDVTKYQSYNKPLKLIPPLRICVIGCIGSGKTTISKFLAKELGLIYVDFAELINDFLLPQHFKKVGRRYENIFSDVPIDDETVVEFQMDEANENVLSDILTNETELRRMVYNYFERGSPLLSPLMHKLITKLWYQQPFSKTGIVLDGFPKLPSDVEDMLSCFCIPDLIIEIEGSSDTALQRVSPIMFKNWKMQLNEAKQKARHKFDIERQEWMNFITKNTIIKLICDEIIDNIFSTALPPTEELKTDSVIIDANPTGSVNVDANLFTTYNEMIQEFPEPVDQNQWEKGEEARERIDVRIESLYETDDENIQSIKDLLLDNRIKIITINGVKSLEKVIRIALSKLNNLRNRCQSFFEKTTIIHTDIAELLLQEGFCFLSKFNRMCPVYIYENPKIIQNIYNVSKHCDAIFPVKHRSYIYFISGKEGVEKFRRNPLKYISISNICNFVEYPLRISVIGTPKSGKSTLSVKLAKRYGLICLSRGTVLRDLLENMPWTELAARVNSAILSGDCIDKIHIMKAVQTAVLDYRTITNGFVLDGFPETSPEAMELCNDGIYPNIVFDISAAIDTVSDNSQREVYFDILKHKPPYSRSFVGYRYDKWQEKCSNIRDWIERDIQNRYIIDGNKSKWQCLHDAVNVINEYIPKVHYYLNNVDRSIVPAHVMCISNEVFQQRLSNLKNMCPVCLRIRILKHSDYPVDKKGVLQYKNKFYWVCSSHMDMVLRHPQSYLSLQNVDIPEIPAVVKTVSMSLVYENGICIVTYAENLPAQKIVHGNNKFAASFYGNTYLFCSEACLSKFMAKPHMYYDITVFKETVAFPPLSLKKLPSIGYLEQTVGNLITDACCSVNVLRPKYPGLSFQVSGLLYIGLYLKTHNPRINQSALLKYIKVKEVYEARCKLLKQVGLFLRSMDNPFAKYPKCCDKIKVHSAGIESNKSSPMASSTQLSIDFCEDVSQRNIKFI